MAVDGEPATIEDELAAPPQRSRGRRILTWVGLALIGLVLLVGALFLFLDTSPGHRLILNQLAKYETESGIRLSAERIEGSIYGRMTLVGIEARDPRGTFLSSDRMLVDWRPFDYLNNRITVRELASPELRILRAPVLREAPTDPDAPLLPDLDIAIGRLAIDRIVVEPPVTGRRHIVRLVGSADIADGRARISVDAAALRGPGAAGGDTLVLRLDAAPDANRLRIAARLAAPAGGLVDSYAGLGRPLAATVGGAGDWRAWNGRATAAIGGRPLANLAITARDGTFRLRGPTRPGVFMAGPVERLASPVLGVDLTAALDERRADLRLVAQSSALRVQAAGLVDLGQSRLGNLRVQAALLTPGAIAPDLSGRDVRASLVLDGPMATPTINYHVQAARLAFGAMGVEGLDARGAARIDADRILVPVAATARRVTGLNAAAGGLLTNLSVNGDLAYADGRLLSDNLRLRSSKIDATAIVVADLAKGRYTGALKGRVNDYQVDGLGRVNLTTDAELVPGRNGGFGIRGVFRVATRTIDNVSLREQLGGNAITTGRFGLDENGVASVTALRLTAPGFRITDGAGQYSLATGRLRFRAAGASRDYGPFTVTGTGTLERPEVRLTAARPGLGVDLRDVVAEVRGTAAGYELSARGQTAYGPLAADILVRSGRGPLAVDIRRALFAGIQITGSVVQTAAGPFAGTLALAGSGLNGQVRLAAAGRFQQADVDLAANAARVPGDLPITIGRGRVQGRLVLYDAGPAVTGSFGLRDLRYGETIVNAAQGRVAYRDGAGTVALTADGRASVPFQLAAQARLSPDRVIANLRGRANNLPFSLAGPAIATRTGDAWTLAPATIVVPQGRLQVSGRYGDGISAQARLANMDVGIVEAAVPGLGLGGRATGTIDYAQPAGAAVPTARVRLDIANFTRTASFVVSDPVDVAMLATLGAEGGDARALIRRGGGVVGRLQARLAPLGPGASLSERLFAAPLSGGIRYNGPAETLWTLTGIAGQTLSGPVAVAADFGGRLQQPSLTGVLRSRQLRYENQTYGTVLSNIAVEGRFTQARLELQSLTARAGTGTVTASGTVGLDAASGFPIDLRARLDRAQLARSDALGATVSGTIAVTNSRAAGALIRGDLTIPEARYQIIRQGAAEIAELEGVRRRTDRPGPPEQSAVPSNWKLDIRVRADNQLFVSGMGLESEWAMDLRVGGTATAPSVTGELQVVRGTYSFAGRRFELDQNGEVRFRGDELTNPELQLAATTTVEGVTAIINIGGRAQNPQVTFTSTPTLPQDEVLSRLLFGSSVTSLSPTQALQLAAALNSLRGSGGGGLNPLGKLRQATGVDRLRVLGADKTAGRGTALAAGKYISNDIYVEVITDTRGFTATQLEIALSRALSLLSQTGSFGGSNVSLRYSKDY